MILVIIDVNDLILFIIWIGFISVVAVIFALTTKTNNPPRRYASDTCLKIYYRPN
jgi:hypothetical protein